MTSEWTNPHSRTPLVKGAVQVWLAHIDQPPGVVARLAPLLSPAEHHHAERFHFARDRQRYIVAHAFLRSILSDSSGVPSPEFNFVSNAYGKPYLEPHPNLPDLHFNLSHSQGCALVAVTIACEVGVDIEYIQPLEDALLISQNFFSPMERKELAALPPPQQQRAFYACWSRKEAFIKGVGWGLAMPLDKFAVALAPDVPTRLTYLHDDYAEHQGWVLYDLPPLPNFASALALPGAQYHITCHSWSPDQFT